MFTKTDTRRSSENSFSVTIKIDTEEAQRRLQNLFDDDFRSHRAVLAVVAIADADGTLWRALDALEEAIAGVYDELQWGYVPERAFLAEGTLAVERVFPKIKALFKDLETADQGTRAQPDLSLRAPSLIADMEEAGDAIEEMRTQLLKELAGPAAELGGETWRRSLAGFFGRKQDISQAKRAEEAHPFTQQMRPPQAVACQYYL